MNNTLVTVVATILRAPFWCLILVYTINEKGVVYKHLMAQINYILRQTHQQYGAIWMSSIRRYKVSMRIKNK
jgi:hypothetical protein